LLTESLLLLEGVEPRVKKRFPELVEVLRPHGELLAFTGSVAQESLNASVGKLLHSLGRFEESERYLLKALARHEGLRAPYITARTRIAMARLYKDWGRPGDKERSLALASQVLGVGLRRVTVAWWRKLARFWHCWVEPKRARTDRHASPWPDSSPSPPPPFAQLAFALFEDVLGQPRADLYMTLLSVVARQRCFHPRATSPPALPRSQLAPAVGPPIGLRPRPAPGRARHLSR